MVAGAYVGREPTQIDFSSDAGDVVTHLTWTSWTATGAVGEGTSDDDTCLPNCANAPVVPEETTVTLSAPIGGHFTAITEVRGTQTQHFAYSGTWPDAATSTTLPTSTPSQTTGGGVGTASLTFTGVISGQLQNAVASCASRPSAESSISVAGTLDGSSWVLSLDSYDADSGIWHVVAGPAGATGMTGPGYGVTATYPAVVSGVTALDWAQGATFDVQLASRTGQTPAGGETVEGTISCGVAELQ